ncbi:UNVERIFIED_CONTAM: hypothetical protein Slati_2115600, partial [Sesamum latifolium]
MCIQDMHWGFLYIFHGFKLRNIKELAIHANDMELSISNHKVLFPIDDQRKNMKDSKRSKQFAKPIVNESMIIKAVPVKISSNDRKSLEKPEDQCMPNDKRR